MKNKRSITTTNAFKKVWKESDRKPNKIWVDEGNEFYNRSVKSWWEINAMEMYLTLNERKSVITERFIRTLKFINTWLQYQEMCIFIS